MISSLGFQKKKKTITVAYRTKKAILILLAVPSILVVCEAADLVAAAVTGRATLSPAVGVAGVAVKSKVRSKLLMTTTGEKRSN